MESLTGRLGRGGAVVTSLGSALPGALGMMKTKLHWSLLRIHSAKEAGFGTLRNRRTTNITNQPAIISD
jgi:hypothetical protein